MKLSKSNLGLEALAAFGVIIVFGLLLANVFHFHVRKSYARSSTIADTAATGIAADDATATSQMPPTLHRSTAKTSIAQSSMTKPSRLQKLMARPSAGIAEASLAGLPSVAALENEYSGFNDKQLRYKLRESQNRVSAENLIAKANSSGLSATESRRLISELRTQTAIRNTMIRRLISE